MDKEQVLTSCVRQMVTISSRCCLWGSRAFGLLAISDTWGPVMSDYCGTGGFTLLSLGSCCSHLECGRIRVLRDVVILRSSSASN
jgi:hypothetical protein